MSEHLKTHHESHEAHERHEQHPAHELQPKPEAAAELSAAEQAQKIEAIHKTIKHEAKAAHEVKVGHHEKEAPSQIGVNRELKQNAYSRLMARTRKQLPLPSRLFSDVVHQPAVDAVSRGAEKTVARPLPVLSAGLFAFVGSVIVLYMAKHYGFSYNLGTFFALLLIGFGIGLLIDLVKIALAKRRSTI
jgi:hypothetical protein